MIAKNVEHLIKGINAWVVKVMELELPSIDVWNNPAPNSVIDEVSAFENTTFRARRVWVWAYFDSYFDAFGAY